MRSLPISASAAFLMSACSSSSLAPPAPDFEEGRGVRFGVVTQQDAERELASGYGCSLSTELGQILVAVRDDAIARPSNNIIHMRFAGASLYEGGDFTRGDLTISVAPVESHGTPDEEVIVRRVSVTVKEGPLTRQFDGRWACGA